MGRRHGDPHYSTARLTELSARLKRSRLGATPSEARGEGPPRGIAPPPEIILFTDHMRLAKPERVIRALPPGRSAVILRDYQRPDRARWARALADYARGFGVQVYVGADFRLARAINADGVHIPRWHIPRSVSGSQVIARRQGLRLSASVHSMDEARRARMIMADWVVISPVFETGSHPEASALGRWNANDLVRVAQRPAVALGGVNWQSPVRALQHFSGLAGVTSFVS